MKDMMNPDSLTGPLKDTVDQIRAAPIPAGLAQRAIEQAAAGAPPSSLAAARTPWRIAKWSALAASVCVGAFLAGAALTWSTQPREVPAVASAPVSTTAPLGATIEPALTAAQPTPPAGRGPAPANPTLQATTGWTVVTPGALPAPNGQVVRRGGPVANATGVATADADGNISVTITNPGAGFVNGQPAAAAVQEAITRAQLAQARQGVNGGNITWQAAPNGDMAPARLQVTDPRTGATVTANDGQILITTAAGPVAIDTPTVAPTAAGTGNFVLHDAADGRTFRVAAPIPAEAQVAIDKFEAQRLAAMRELQARTAAQGKATIAQLQMMQQNLANSGQAADAAALQARIAQLQAELAISTAQVNSPPAIFTSIDPARNSGWIVTPQPPAPVTKLTAYRNQVGQTITVIATGSTAASIWGGDKGIYTDDSPLGTAAVHAGILKEGQTASLNVTILPGQASYAGSTKNGISSAPYAKWEGSYRIEGIAAGAQAAGGPAFFNAPVQTINIQDGTLTMTPALPNTAADGSTAPQVFVINGGNNFTPAVTATDGASVAPVPVKTGSLSGKILDKDGKPAVRATVQFVITPPGGGGGGAAGAAVGRGRGRITSVLSDDTGGFTLKSVPVGTGSLSASLITAEGAQRATQRNIEITQDKETRLDAEIHLQAPPGRGPAIPGGG